MPGLRQAAVKTIDVEALFSTLNQYEAIGLAVSGGPDSLALMLLAHRWAGLQPGSPRLVVYSVDHGLRPEAAEEVAMVVRSARELGLEARPLRWEGAKPETGLQEAARAARYGLIGEAMVEDGVPILLTAHHRDDQAETILMRLAHGSGVEGLRGMDRRTRVEGVEIMRPLLDMAREELARVAEEGGMSPVFDPSNEDESYERVRWRKQLPPLAELGLDSEALSRFARRMGEADAALAEIAEAAFETVVMLDGFGAARMERAAFAALSPAIATRVLRRVLNIAGGRQKPRALGQIEKLRDDLVGNDAFAATTIFGSIVRFERDEIVVMREPGRMAIPRHHLVPNSEVVWDDRFVIANRSEDTGLTIGFAAHLDRRKLSEFLGFRVTAPTEAIRTAPIVRDGEGNMLALGAWSFDDRVRVRLLTD